MKRIVWQSSDFLDTRFKPSNSFGGLKSALLMSVILPTVLSTASAAATCGAATLLCNGGFDSLTAATGSDAVLFDNWTSSDPDALRVGLGADGTGNSAEFLFSTTSLSQAVATGVGSRYTVSLQYKSDGGQGLTAYFGDARIFAYVGDDAPPIGWTTYSFNIQAFSSQTVLRFVADSQGAAQNIDGVSVTLCPTCTPNLTGNLGAVIDRNQAFYTTADAAGLGTNLSGVRTLTFDGGTLRPSTAGSLGQAGQPVTLALNVAATGGTIDNNGQNIALAGTIINTAVAASPFTLTGSGQGTIASAINNLGTLVVTSTGRTNLSGAIDNAAGILAIRNGGQANLAGGLSGGSVLVESGQLYVNSLVASTMSVGTLGTLRGSGRVSGTVNVSGILRPGNSPGTLSVAGTVNQAAGSTLALEIDGTGTGNGAGNYSRLIIAGAGSRYVIGTGVTLVPVLRGITYVTGETAGTNSFTLSLGQRLAGVVQAEGGVTGTFATIAQPTAGLANGSRIVALYNPTSIDLYVATASYGGLVGLTRNHAAAGSAVDALEASRNTAAMPLLNALIPLGLDGLSTAVAGISGELNANLSLAATDVGRGFGNIVVLRQGGLLQAGDGWQSWGRAFGGRARTTDDGNNPGFRNRTAGAMVGVDYGTGNGLRGGLAVGYADSKVTGRNDSGTASIDSYHAGGYLGWDQDAMFADAQVGMTFSDYETARRITVGTQTRAAVGKTDGSGIGAGVETGYRLDIGSGTITPTAFLRYDSSDADAFTEAGADVLNLSVADDKQSDWRGGLGLRFSHTLALGNGGTLTPELSARWEHLLSDGGYSTDLALLGQSFTVHAAEPGRDSAVLGGGLGLDMPDNLRLTARYDAELSANRTQHALTAQVRYSW